MKDRGIPLLLPTAPFAGLLFVIGVVWYAAANQNSAPTYLLLFCLTSVFLVSIPHTLLNLGSLKATAGSVKPAFAGQEVSLPVEITNQSRAVRHAIVLSLPESGGDGESVDALPAGKSARLTLRFSAPKRGEHGIGSLCLTSRYPLGFVRASKRINMLQRYLVYPKPAGDPNLPIGSAHSPRDRPQQELGEGDDFAGVRAYLPGESQRHIDWKAVARGQPLMTKQFSVETDTLLFLDFARVQKDREARLSQLALWVIEAERARCPYGLRLPAAEIAPSMGEQHFHRCLRALALFE